MNSEVLKKGYSKFVGLKISQVEVPNSNLNLLVKFDNGVFDISKENDLELNSS